MWAWLWVRGEQAGDEARATRPRGEKHEERASVSRDLTSPLNKRRDNAFLFRSVQSLRPPGTLGPEGNRARGMRGGRCKLASDFAVTCRTRRVLPVA
ncbi:hypothetical protein EYF80_027322 [Liparis tanakae]|uniref:Uncharacterized protein n=1 Tax=Liparis tanakae TaxID=230148 RepID=A0A4Z2HBZ1_9TELE|nr:hypothetical protein EYF80_027322 [Liparis tanakae]